MESKIMAGGNRNWGSIWASNRWSQGVLKARNLPAINSWDFRGQWIHRGGGGPGSRSRWWLMMAPGTPTNAGSIALQWKLDDQVPMLFERRNHNMSQHQQRSEPTNDVRVSVCLSVFLEIFLSCHRNLSALPDCFQPTLPKDIWKTATVSPPSNGKY